MNFSDLVDQGASERELRSYLADGEQVPITVRIPEQLRESIRSTATLEGMSLSAFIRSCLIDKLVEVARR